MKNIFTIMKKELKRFFSDKRMLLGLIIPGILIFVCYTLMGNFISGIGEGDSQATYKVAMVNQPEEYKVFDSSNDKFNIEVINITEAEIETVKEDIKNKDTDLLIVYTADFISKVGSSDVPQISFYFNSSKNNSQAVYTYYETLLSKNSIKETTYNYLISEPENLASIEDVSSQIITMMLPFILIIFLFTGCMSVSTESIAGEKERGTIATLLVTPTRRSDIALGKIFALAITSLVSAASSFLGLMLSLPRMFAGMDGFTLSMYGPVEYILLFLLIAVTVVFFTVVLTNISTISKSVKEATSYAMPVMIVTMLVGILSFVSNGVIPSNPALYLIPIYNIVMSLGGIFSMQLNILNLTITIISNVAFIGIGIYILTRLFNNEKVMFNK